MAQNYYSLFSGALFAVGLIISGMTNPKKVLGFLDIFGQWDYSLAFVMIGAIGVSAVTFRFIKKRSQAWCGRDLDIPNSKTVDYKLVGGAALFGIGWGLMGVCPGPGIVNLVTLNPVLLAFVASMVGGMLIYKISMSGPK